MGVVDDHGQAWVASSDDHWTIGDALRFLDPQPPRRTLARWLKAMPVSGEKVQRHGGPPAKTHRASEIMKRHADWARTRDEKESG